MTLEDLNFIIWIFSDSDHLPFCKRDARVLHLLTAAVSGGDYHGLPEPRQIPVKKVQYCLKFSRDGV